MKGTWCTVWQVPLLTLFRALPPMSSKYMDRGSENVVQDRLGHFRAVLGIPDLRASVHNTARKKSKSALAGRVGIGWRSVSSVSGARFQDMQVADESASQSLERVGTVATQGDWSLGGGDADVSAPRAETGRIRAVIEACPGAHTALGLASPSTRCALASPSTAVRPGVFAGRI